MLNIVKTKQVLSKWPPWILTIIVSLAILYLTLVPQPLPDDTPQLFPGADKVVHGLMFGGLTLVILLDFQRRGNIRAKDGNDWQPLSAGFIFTVAADSAFAGIVIECLQYIMGLGRGFEMADILADTIGSFVFATLWLLLQHYWTDPSDHPVHP